MEAPGQMKVIVVIASSTRGFAAPQADTPLVISPYAGHSKIRMKKAQ
jgi:hypothetical protein